LRLRKGAAKNVVEQTTVLIISDDAELARSITTRWQMERHVPAFTLMGGDLCASLPEDSFGLAILAGLSSRGVDAALFALESVGKPVLIVTETPPASVRDLKTSQVTVLPQAQGWTEVCVLLGAALLRRQDAIRRAERAEQAAATVEHQATLGRYMLEVRHTLNNALTSVLGNSELLLLDPAGLTPGQLTQLETIRTMAVRVHEILARFSSLDIEMRFVGQQKEHGESRLRAAVAE
jgi:signal transduction histidine kinase